MAEPVLHIAVGVLRTPQGVLLSQRRAGTHGAGEWEFPGGKVEPDEDVRGALARELAEELGIQVTDARPLIRVRHRYAERTVLLDTWLVEHYRGAAQSREGQRLAWVAADQLPRWPLMAADGPIVTAVRLPDTYLFTGDFADARDAEQRLEAALDRGVRLMRLRAPHLDNAAYEALAARLVARCHHRGARCLLDRSAPMVRRLGADGLHLTGAALQRCARRTLPHGLWLAASCHGDHDLHRAQAVGADFAVLSPVAPTRSHPQAAALSWERFRAWVEAVNLPVYGLGGLGLDARSAAWTAGAQGIAAISALWR